MESGELSGKAFVAAMTEGQAKNKYVPCLTNQALRHEDAGSGGRGEGVGGAV
jgi:hypothetical protein